MPAIEPQHASEPPPAIESGRRPRVLSGMRPTGALHLGHYHGALKNWVRLQDDYECYFFVADWHALTTHYEEPGVVARNIYDMVTDWLAAGIDPDRATIFIQSRLPEHAELFTLLAMGTPIAWLERTPSYRDQIAKLKDRDLATYGFLGYPLLQAADILIYKAAYVPVGEDQAPHVEITREIARRFNHLYGRGASFEALRDDALARLGPDAAGELELRRAEYQRTGSADELSRGAALLRQAALTQPRWSEVDTEVLMGHVRGIGRTILPEPQVLLTETSRMPGLDGGKMSKSIGNTIDMREAPEAVERKIRRMPTDPQRVHRNDPGEPGRCPVWPFHVVYANADTREILARGCRSADIGCLDCKQPLIDAVLAEQRPWRERADAVLRNPKQLEWIVEVGTERARTVARETMAEVRAAMGLRH